MPVAVGRQLRHPYARMTLREDLYEWLADQPAWQKDLAKRLVSRTQLDGAEHDEALRVVTGVFGALEEGESAPEPQPLALANLPAGSSTGPAPRLVGFGRLRGVGAVAADQELAFATNGLTVIYGPNGAGKSTYVRGLKRVCRTVDCDSEVRGNVFAAPVPGSPAPSAKVEFIAGELRAQQLNLADPPDLGLGAISVFDARCAELYVDAQNAVAYVPTSLLLLARLAATQDRMRRDLNRQMDSLASGRPAFPEFEAPTAAKARLEHLSATSDLGELRRFATLDNTERARLAELRAVIASTQSHSAHADAQAAQQDAIQAETLARQLRALSARVADQAVETIHARAVEAVSAQEAVHLAAREFTNLPVAGVGGETWQRLWRAAREFNEQQSIAFPPAVGDHCPLCMQEVRSDVAAGMAHFEEHVRSSVQEDARMAQQALATELETLGDEHVAACRTHFLAGLGEREAELHAAVERYLDAIAGRMATLRHDPIGAQVLPFASDAAAQLEEWGRERGTHAETLFAAENPDRRRELRSELAELDAREKLAARMPDVTASVRTLARIAALRRAHSALATNRITTMQRQLTDAVVTHTLGGQLRQELSHLHCEHVPVDLQPHTAVGATQVVLRLAGAHGTPRVSDILSEGEQRALSLAFFFAEVETSEGDGGIIVDDPVSSLDDERRGYIAKRLVAESQRRQVILFTHDLPFLLDLTDQAEEAGVEPLVQGVWRMGSQVGRVDDHPPFMAMKLPARVHVLNEQVEHWDDQDAPRDFDEAWRRVRDFYARMRTTWERAVEERLLRGVVQRFQRDVKTRALKDIDISPELVAAVTEGMTRCSTFVHDAPPGTATSPPGRRELWEDLAKLQAFEKQTK